ncbi:DUF3027 domain-containing protein [Specibacter cremeus]|uniref:DUF3027 domain-containing protein n=1 Tax=Specibacter cremeus TaxID=1629051 RepID=UPI000F795AF4
MTEPSAAPGTETGTETATGPDVSGAPAAPVRPRAGLPVWRTGKPDAFLADAVEQARAALADIAAPGQIGAHVAVRSEGVRTVTHLFESKLAGYRGWVWFATLTRLSRSKDATVNEVGLLPTEDSVLAPAWVPWADRLRPEDAKAEPVVEPVDR